MFWIAAILIGSVGLVWVKVRRRRKTAEVDHGGAA